jgi:predicted transcriptional regulator
MSDFAFEWQNVSIHYCVQQSNIPASCTDDGVTEWYCSTCDETIKYVTGYAFGHDIVEVEAQAPTCTEIGWDAYEYCTACTYTTYVELPVDTDAHDWSNKDGICARENCGYECVHANYADGACDNCDVKQKYTVRMETKLSKGVEFVGNPVAIHGEDLIIEFKNLVSEKCNDVSLFELTIGANSFYEFEFDENGITFDGTVLTIPGELVNGDVETHANAYTQARIKLNGGKFSPECPPDIVEEYFIENDYAISNKMLVGYNNSVKDTFVKDKHTIKSILASDGNDYNKIYYFSPNSDLEMTIEWECLPENFENGVCVECGYECPHEWSEGSLVRPTRTEEGYYTYTCSICKDTKTELVERPANYAEFKELIEKVKGYLDENLTDSMMQEVNNIINFFDLDENHRFIKGEENTVSQNIRQISEFVEVVEEGIADGTAVKVNGNAIVNKMVDEWAEKIEAEGLVDAYIEFVNNNKATEEAKAEDEEIMKFAKSLEGSVAENADNIKQLEGMVSEFLACFENCLSGAHNVREYEVIEAAKCGENAVEEGACWFCGEIVTREAEDTALTHSFTKYEVVDAPACGKEGKEVAACDNGCGATDEKAIEALKHDIVIDEAVAPKCGETGLTQGEHCTRCDYKVEQEIVPALEHKDADGDYKCDNGCGHEFEKPAPEEPTPDTPDEPTDDACDHLCHKSGILGFFWKIVKFFSKLFKINPVCECGVAHY